MNGGEDDVNTDEDPEEIIDGNKDEVVHEGQQGIPDSAQHKKNKATGSDIRKVSGYISDYIESSDPGSYSDTSEDSTIDDARRHKSSMMIYDPNVPLDDFCLDLRFTYLKLFKHELIEFSTRRGFEFKYIKNDSKRVRAKCAGKECKWLIFCSLCNGKKMYVVEHYVS